MTSPNAMRRGYEITNRKTGEVEHFVDCAGKSDNAMDRIEIALLMRTDMEKYFIREVGR